MSDLTLSVVLGRIEPVDSVAIQRARSRQDRLTKPPGSLGRLEDVSIQLAGIFRTDKPQIRGKAVVVAAGDHGVVAQGVTGFPQEVTAQMVLNFLAGGAAVSVMSRRLGIEMTVVDAGVASDLPNNPAIRSVSEGKGTADISKGPAMSLEQAESCILSGVSIAVELTESDIDLIGTGEMGIGNTTPSSAIAAVMTGQSPKETTGKGTGRNDQELRHKIDVVQEALTVNNPDPADALGVIAKVGGFEIGVLVGVVLGTAMMRRAVVLDGFISTAAAMIAHGLSPMTLHYMIASHCSAEKGHRLMLDHLDLRPLLDLDLRLGEGTGAVLSMGIVEAAAACLSEMATFGEAGVSEG